MALIKKIFKSLKKLFTLDPQKYYPKPRNNSPQKKKSTRQAFKAKKKSPAKTVVPAAKISKKKAQEAVVLKNLKGKKEPVTFAKPVEEKAKPSLKARKEKVEKKEVVQGELIGIITHYFPKIQVVVLKIVHDRLIVGDKICIRGKETNASQKVSSMQINSVDVKVARKGEMVGLKVVKEAQVGDKVYLVK